MSLQFFITSLIVVIMPGTGMIFTLVTSLGYGARLGLLAALGGTLSIISHIFAAVIGVAALLHASAVAFQIVKFLGVAYLLWMAVRTFRESGQFDMLLSETARSPSAFAVVRDGILLNLLNPKLSLFFLAFLPQFIDAEAAHPVAEMILLGGIFMLMTFLVFALVGVAAASVRDKILTQPNVLIWLRRSFASAFLLLGLKLAMAER
ncbi:LysE family translocator [uncultured Cohaesibacter sp.]|uniref:LysE family translocator n=1 Tax=uncultured Cohaesibacter sp. TaxID=1002546 RepID=UPI00292F530B|nr:LysE family translocator [uncultured Cohaesibacter sp.]